MLKNIPCHLIAGPLGAGKTSLLRNLLAQRPVSERWAVLVNEFGRIGLDAALLAGHGSGVEVREIAGGCLCCVNGLPFQIGLNRLLRQARPDRLLIEASGLGHPRQLLAQLAAAPWTGVLAVQPLLLVLDAAALADGVALADAHREVLQDAGLVILNKAETLTGEARQRVAAGLSGPALVWTEHGCLALAQLPGADRHAEPGGDAPALPAEPVPPGALWLDPQQPLCQTQTAVEGWSIGWRWDPRQRFERAAIERWLDGLGWRRAKLVLRTPAGAFSLNAVAGQPLRWQASEWRRDSRLELIFSEPGDAEQLGAALRHCLVDSGPHQ